MIKPRVKKKKAKKSSETKKKPKKTIATITQSKLFM